MTKALDRVGGVRINIMTKNFFENNTCFIRSRPGESVEIVNAKEDRKKENVSNLKRLHIVERTLVHYNLRPVDKKKPTSINLNYGLFFKKKIYKKYRFGNYR